MNTASASRTASAASVAKNSRPSRDVARDQVQPRLEDRHHARLRAGDLAVVLVDAGDDVAEVGETGPGHEPDIARADHRDAHPKSPRWKAKLQIAAAAAGVEGCFGCSAEISLTDRGRPARIFRSGARAGGASAGRRPACRRLRAGRPRSGRACGPLPASGGRGSKPLPARPSPSLDRVQAEGRGAGRAASSGKEQAGERSRSQVSASSSTTGGRSARGCLRSEPRPRSASVLLHFVREHAGVSAPTPGPPRPPGLVDLGQDEQVAVDASPR